MFVAVIIRDLTARLQAREVAEQLTKPEGASSGLGLATVYDIISQAGGPGEIRSEAGTGTTVTSVVSAPDASVQAADQRLVGSAPAHGGETILLVEDGEAMRDVIRRMLTRNGYRVLVAPSAIDACAIAIDDHDEIHLLLTDIIMPRMQGRELASRIRAARPEMRVLYMSGYAHSVLTTQGKLDQSVFLLEKPFTESVLLSNVRAALDSPR